MKNSLFTIQDQVQNILEIYPKARESDEKLYAVYLTDKIGVVSAINFFNNFDKYRDYVAPFETISRARRKVQEIRPDLRPQEKVLEARDDLQGTFFDWARGVGNG